MDREWAYNSLDVVGTREVFDTLLPRLSPARAVTYGFERALQGPALTMMKRGVLVDIPARDRAVVEFRKELDAEMRKIGQMKEVTNVWDRTKLQTGKCPATATPDRPDGTKPHKWPRGVPDAARRCERCDAARVIPKPFNPGSHDQCFHLFYGLYGVPPITNKKGKETTDDEALDRIGRLKPALRGLTDSIREVRDRKKQLGFLKGKLTPDRRYGQTVNVGAAWTGRFSSSKNPFGEGGNLQNVSERHRHIFIADPGKLICYADLKQAESLCVAYLAGDEGYINAHKTGDTHTYVCRLLWPELPWTGDLARDKKVAKTLPDWDPVPGHDYRFQAKRIQHGSNYGLTPYGIAMIAHIPRDVSARAQRNYFSAFPGILVWQGQTRKEVEEQRVLTNPLGRECELFGRPWDEHTYKQGLAFRPQSAVADVLNLALYRVWKECDPGLVELLAQVHDAILCQFRVTNAKEAIQTIERLMTIPVHIGPRTMTIPVEIAVGRNWGHKSDTNPVGIDDNLKEYLQ